MSREIAYYEMSYEDIAQVSAMELKYFSQPWTEAGIGHYMEAGNTIFLVAKDTQDASLVGYCALMYIADEAELISIAVREDCRGYGIAREMLDISYEMLRDRDVVTIHLEVRESNEAAIGLYESEGFERVGLRKDFYSKPEENALLYTLRLQPEDEDNESGEHFPER
ncbi:MAG: ribosomal protein S18-alanine N-acetyltransferase [Lachnospiraceae bacterium]